MITEIASLESVKRYLRIPNPADANDDDDTIQMLMDAARVVVERELGRIVAKTVTAERHNGGKCEIWLRELPVLYVQSVEEGWGDFNEDLDDQEVNQSVALSVFAFSLDIPKEGLLTRRSAGNVLVPFVNGRNNVRIDYVAGRTEMPANAVLVFCELVSFWYRNTQLRAVNSAGTLGMGAQTAFGALNTDFTRSTGETSVNQGIPEGLLALLTPNRRRPIVG